MAEGDDDLELLDLSGCASAFLPRMAFILSRRTVILCYGFLFYDFGTNRPDAMTPVRAFSLLFSKEVV